MPSGPERFDHLVEGFMDDDVLNLRCHSLSFPSHLATAGHGRGTRPGSGTVRTGRDPTLPPILGMALPLPDAQHPRL